MLATHPLKVKFQRPPGRSCFSPVCLLGPSLPDPASSCLRTWVPCALGLPCSGLASPVPSSQLLSVPREPSLDTLLPHFLLCCPGHLLTLRPHLPPTRRPSLTRTESVPSVRWACWLPDSQPVLSTELCSLLHPAGTNSALISASHHCQLLHAHHLTFAPPLCGQPSLLGGMMDSSDEGSRDAPGPRRTELRVRGRKSFRLLADTLWRCSRAHWPRALFLHRYPGLSYRIHQLQGSQEPAARAAATAFCHTLPEPRAAWGTCLLARGTCLLARVPAHRPPAEDEHWLPPGLLLPLRTHGGQGDGAQLPLNWQSNSVTGNEVTCSVVVVASSAPNHRLKRAAHTALDAALATSVKSWPTPSSAGKRLSLQGREAKLRPRQWHQVE